MNNKIRFAVIGCGHIGKRHAETINRNEEAELVALIDNNTELHSTLQSTYSHPVFESLAAFTASGMVCDVICVATPNGVHASQTIEAIDAGYHVVVEKPMALTKKDCEAMIYKALQRSRYVFCVMQNRYSPPSEWLKKIVSEGVLGNVYMVNINCFWNRDERYYKPGTWHGTQKLDGGTLFTQFSHFIDLMYWVFGDIDDIKASFSNHGHKNMVEFEDSGMVSFKFINGGSGCLNFSTAVWDKNFESTMTIIAENGTVKIGGQYMDKVEYCHIKNYTLPNLQPTNPPNDYGPYRGSAANHHYVIENVVNVLKGRATITTNALEGLKVVDIIERIYLNKKLEN